MLKLLLSFPCALIFLGGVSSPCSGVFCSRRLDISTGELLEVIAACATPQLASMPLRDLANLSWAFAVQRRLHPEMMAGVGREVSSQWWLAFFPRKGVVVI